MTIKEYLEIIGLKGIASNTKELRDLLDNNGFSELWDYPLEEIDYIKENELNVIKIEDRFFETGEDFKRCYYCGSDRIKFNYTVEATSNFNSEDLKIGEYDSLNPQNIRCNKCGVKIELYK